MNCLEIGGDAGRAEHVAAELDPEAGVGRAPARHAVGVDAVHRLVAGSNVGDRGSGASWCCSVRLLQSINSESIMAEPNPIQMLFPDKDSLTTVVNSVALLISVGG